MPLVLIFLPRHQVNISFLCCLLLWGCLRKSYGRWCFCSWPKCRCISHLAAATSTIMCSTILLCRETCLEKNETPTIKTIDQKRVYYSVLVFLPLTTYKIQQVCCISVRSNINVPVYFPKHLYYTDVSFEYTHRYQKGCFSITMGKFKLVKQIVNYAMLNHNFYYFF